MTVCTRFAPSPTGELHLGNIRTALYCWLYAKKCGGKFILRIEDTDRERSTTAAVDGILDTMRWLGLDWDAGPIYQTERFPRYAQVIEELLNSGHAYRCYCSKERLDELHAQQVANKDKPKYDGHCRNKDSHAAATAGSNFVIRFRNPETGTVSFDDYIRGTVTVQNSELDDLVIARSDSTPTYNFAVVIDDSDMEITDVIRGADHIMNTPRQINIFTALGKKPPNYAHVPTVLNEHGERLSKRHGAISVLQYRRDGFLKEALINYLVRLGWSHGDQEIFSVAELQQLFDVHDINKAATSVNPTKLLWLNQHYLKTLDVNYIADELAWQLQQLDIDYQHGPALTEVVLAQRERVKTMQEMAQRSAYLFADTVQLDPEAAHKHLTPEVLPALRAIKTAFSQLITWNDKEAIHQVILSVATELGMGIGKVAQPVRVAVTGNTVSPPIDLTLQLIGKDRVVARLAAVITWIEARVQKMVPGNG